MNREQLKQVLINSGVFNSHVAAALVIKDECPTIGKIMHNLHIYSSINGFDTRELFWADFDKIIDAYADMKNQEQSND